MEAKEVKKKKGPRRPMNAFLIFCKRHRSKQRERNPEMDNRTITRVLGDMWAQLGEAEKSVYNDIAKENKEAFMRANPDYKWRGSDKSSQGSSSSKSATGGQQSTSGGKSMSQATKENRTVSGASAGQPKGTGPLLKTECGTPTDGKKRSSASSPVVTSSSQSSSHLPPSSSVLSAQLMAGKLTTPPPHAAAATHQSPTPKGGPEGESSSSQEHTSALLQLAEMCTSELYSSTPSLVTNNTSLQAHSSPSPPSSLSSSSPPSSSSSLPLPPPKKRARQWRLDCAQGSQASPQPNVHGSLPSGNGPLPAPKSNKQSGSGNKPSKRQRNSTARNAQSASKSSSVKSLRNTNTTSSKFEKTGSGTSSQLDQPRPSPPSGYQEGSLTNASGLVCREINQSTAFSTQGHQLPGQPPPSASQAPPPPPLPDLFQSQGHLDRSDGPKTQEVLASFDRLAWRDSSSEKAIDFSSRSTGEFKGDHPGKFDFFSEKKPDLPLPLLPLCEKGKIASLLSSPLPFTAGQTTATCPQGSSNFSIPNPTTTGKSEVLDFQKSSPTVETNSPPSDALLRKECGLPSSNGTTSFTEGKLKKKWTQRMMVEAKKEEEDQARQIAWSSRQDAPLPAAVSVQLESPPCLKTDPSKIFPSDKFLPFNYCKSEITAKDSCDLSKPADRNVLNLNSGSSLSSTPLSCAKPEPFQSKTLYRALMGQAPSHLCLSSYSSSNKNAAHHGNNSPVFRSGLGINPESSITPKVEDDKKVFTPIAACGKKIMDHIVERLFQTGYSADAKQTATESSELDGSQKECHVPQIKSEIPTGGSPLLQQVKSVGDEQTELAAPSLPSSALIGSNSLMEKVVMQMCRSSSVQQSECRASDVKKCKVEAPFDGQTSAELKWPKLTEAADYIKKEEVDPSLSNAQNELPGDGMEDTNLAELPDDSAFQPVRKSRRANRGQKYQALIKEGIIQPSKERLAARNAERNVKSTSSREELEKSEPAKRVLKRAHSERESSVLPVPSVTSCQTSESGGISPSGQTKVFDLEKEIASLPTCSFDQFEEKKKMPQSKGMLDNSTQKRENNGGNAQPPKAANKDEPGDNRKHKVPLKSVNAKTTSCHASIKELGCHMVHVPLIQEERPTECLTGSRKRKARRHCITRISVAPPSRDADSKHEKSSAPSKDSSKTKLGINGKTKTRMVDNKWENAHSSPSATAAFPTRQAFPEGFFDVSAVAAHDKEGQFLTSKDCSSSSGRSGEFPHHYQQQQQLQHHHQNVHQSFPALTLLSSVMIDSEKAVSPSCQKDVPPTTTQSPTPAAKAGRPWQAGVAEESGNGGNSSVAGRAFSSSGLFMTAAASHASSSPSSSSFISGGASVPAVENGSRLAKFDPKNEAGSQLHRQQQQLDHQMIATSNLISMSSSTTSPLPAPLAPPSNAGSTMPQRAQMKLFPEAQPYSDVPSACGGTGFPPQPPSSSPFAMMSDSSGKPPPTHSWPALLMSASFASSAAAFPPMTTSSSSLPSPPYHQQRPSAIYDHNTPNSSTNHSTPSSANAGKKSATATVPSPFVISTLPPSKTTSDVTQPHLPSSHWPSKSTTSSSASSHKQPSTSLRRKKSAKAGSAMATKVNDDKRKAMTADASAVGSHQQALDPGTKKLVKLLLKGDGVDEPSMAQLSNFEPQTIFGHHNPDARQENVNPNLSPHRPPPNHPEQQSQSKRRQTSKASKGEDYRDVVGVAGGLANASPAPQKAPSCSAPLYLSLKTQLETKRQIFTTDKYAEPPITTTQPGGAKKHKPTIWDHLNSQNCLPISSVKTMPTTLQTGSFSSSSSKPGLGTPARKRSGNQQRGGKVSSNPRSGAATTKSTKAISRRTGGGAKKKKGSDGSAAVHREVDRRGSDTESANEETADRASSDTDSAEETEEVISPSQTAHNNSRATGQSSSAAFSQSDSSSKVQMTHGSNHLSQAPDASAVTEGTSGSFVGSHSTTVSTILPSGPASSSKLPVPPLQATPSSGSPQLATLSASSMSTTQNYTKTGKYVLNQPSVSSLVGISKSTADSSRPSASRPPVGSQVALTSTPSSAHTPVHPTDDVAPPSPHPVFNAHSGSASSVLRPSPSSTSSSSPAVYLPVIVSTKTSNPNNNNNGRVASPNALTVKPATGCSISVAPLHPASPRIPLADVNPLSSSSSSSSSPSPSPARNSNLVEFDAKCSTPPCSASGLITDGCAAMPTPTSTTSNSSPLLPGSPSMAVVQS